MDGGFFKGTSTEQDQRFKDKESMLLKKMKFPASFDQKVDMNKVEVAVLKPWIARKVVELLGFEDDVLIEYINSILEDDSNKIIDAKKMQLNLTGFMEKKTPVFMNQLWNMLLSAQANPLKVPTELLEEKKREMREREQQKAIEQRKEDHIQEVRQRERQERNASRFDDSRAGSSRGRGGGGPYRGRGGGQSGRGRPNYRNDDRRDYRDRSPPPRRRYSRSPTPRGRSYSRSRSPRSPSPPRRSSRRYSRSLSRSRSPPPRRRRRSSYSRSPSPAPRRPRDRSHERRRSPSRSRSPPPSRRRDYSRSPSPERGPRTSDGTRREQELRERMLTRRDEPGGGLSIRGAASRD